MCFVVISFIFFGCVLVRIARNTPIPAISVVFCGGVFFVISFLFWSDPFSKLLGSMLPFDKSCFVLLMLANGR